MRISLVHHILSSVVLSEHGLVIAGSKANNFVVKNIVSLKELINRIRPTGLFLDEISELDSYGLGNMVLDSVLLDGGTANALVESSRKLLKAINTTRKAFDVVTPAAGPDSVYILLPSTHDVYTLTSDLTEICRALEPHIIHENIGGKISIQRWENGSFWVEIMVATHSAVIIVGAIASAAVLVMKKRQESKILEGVVTGLKIKNDSLKDVSEALKESLKLLISEQAKRISTENLRSDDQEDIKRLEHSIKVLSELIEKGTEIHPALMAPEDIRHLFPHQKELPSPSMQLLLPDSSADDAIEHG